VEIALAIIASIIVCKCLMLSGYYKPARFRTSYSNVDKRNSGGDARGSSWDNDAGGGD
jgi:hypothetical protein